MSQHIKAIFENGVFRPEMPVNIISGEQVSLEIQPLTADRDDLNDLWDLLDVEFIDACRQRTGDAPSLEEVRKVLSAFEGSLSDLISQERDER
jgi:predicted DNA-binding antitoxin AbrB/MazE fold protein